MTCGSRREPAEGADGAVGGGRGECWDRRMAEDLRWVQPAAGGDRGGADEVGEAPAGGGAPAGAWEVE